MDASDGILIGAIIVSLFVGLRSLRQTRNIQKREQERRILNEILDWAIEITERSSGTPIPLRDEDTGVETYVKLEQIDTIRDFDHLNKRSEIIKGIALLLSKDLYIAVENVTQKLRELLSIRWDILSIEEVNKALIEYGEEVHNSAENLISEVSKLITKGKGRHL